MAWHQLSIIVRS